MSLSDVILAFLQKNPNPVEEADTKVKLKLLSHDIFQEFDFINRVRVDKMRIDDTIKRRMAIRFVRIFYEKLAGKLSTMVDDYTMYAYQPNKINALIYQWLEEVKKETLSSGIPEIFLDKYNPRMITNVEILTNIITEVCQRNMYSTPEDTICAVLDVTLLFVRFSMDSIEGIINHMNGELHLALQGSIFDN